MPLFSDLSPQLHSVHNKYYSAIKIQFCKWEYFCFGKRMELSIPERQLLPGNEGAMTTAMYLHPILTRALGRHTLAA